MAIDPVSLAVGSFVLGELAGKALDVAVDEGAKGLVRGRTGLAEWRQFQKVLEETWAAFEQDSEVDYLLARSLRAILWDRSENAQRFRAEAVKLLWSAEEPDVGALAWLYEEKLHWATDVWGEVEAPEWDDLEAPLIRFFELLRVRLLDDKKLGKAMAERSTLDWLWTAADALTAVQAILEGTTTGTGALRVVVEEVPGPTEEEWAKAEQRYLDHVIEKHRNLSLFITQFYGGQVPPMAELEKVFVCLNLQSGRRPVAEEARGRLDEAVRLEVEGRSLEFEQRMIASERSREAVVETVSIGQAMERHRRLLVVGAPGSGKTTLLRWVALKHAQGQAVDELELDEARLPIFLPLRDFGFFLSKREKDYGPPGPVALADFTKYYFRQMGLELPAGFFTRAFDDGRAVLLLDGLDEVPDPSLRTRAAQMVTAFMGHYKDNRYLLASRPRGYDEVASALPGLPLSEVQDLSDEQVAEFVLNFCRVIERHGRTDEMAEAERAAQKRADDILGAIKANRGIRSLARNPLHLSVIVLVHKYRNAPLPERRVDVYRESVSLLLGYWDVRREVEDPLGLVIDDGTEARYGDVDIAVEEKQSLLAPLALWMHKQRLRVVEETKIVGELARRFVEDDDLPPRRAKTRARRFLAAAHGRSGILVEGSQSLYNFSHQGFQEYLAARELVGGDDYVEQVLAHLHDPWWEEVILLTAAQLQTRRATALLEAILTFEHDDPVQGALDEMLNRHLILVARCLADIPYRGVSGALRRSVVEQLLSIACHPPICTAQRPDTIKALGRLRYDSVAKEGLLNILQYGAIDPATRQAATLALKCGLKDVDVTVEALLVVARDRAVDGWARQVACDLMACMDRPNEAALAYLGLAADGSAAADVRRAAASALGQLGEASEEVMSGLLGLAADGSVDVYVRSEAASALGQLGEVEKAVDLLLGLAADGSVAAYVRSAAASALGQLGEVEKAADLLLGLAADGSVAADVRRAAASALGQLGEASEDVLSGLLGLAADGSVAAHVRRAAASALGQLGEGEKAADLLLGLAADGSVAAYVRSEAASALGQLGEGEKAVDLLLGLAADGSVDAYVRREAVSALGQLGEASEEVLSGLLGLAADGSVDADVRRAAASALGQLGEASEEVMSGLLGLAADGSVAADVRSEAASALGQLGEVEKAADLLLGLAVDGSVAAHVRSAVASALGQLREVEKAADLLLGLAVDGSVDTDVRSEAASALGRLGEASEEVVSGLLRLLRLEVIPASRRLAGTDIDWKDYLKSSAYRSLQRLTSPEPEADE